MDKSKNHKKKQRDSKEVSAPAAAFATMCVFLLSGPSLWWKLARWNMKTKGKARTPNRCWLWTELPRAQHTQIHPETSTIPETHRAHHTHARVLLENKSFMFPEQVTTVTSHLSVQPTLNKNWGISIDAGVCPYTKNFFPFFFFWLMTLKYWNWWNCILCLKKPGCVSRSFPEASSKDA